MESTELIFDLLLVEGRGLGSKPKFTETRDARDFEALGVPVRHTVKIDGRAGHGAHVVGSRLLVRSIGLGGFGRGEHGQKCITELRKDDRVGNRAGDWVGDRDDTSPANTAF